MSKSIEILVIISIIVVSGCLNNNNHEQNTTRDYRQNMRDFVQNISTYAKEFNSDFIIIPQNGLELLTKNGSPNGSLSEMYLDSIDGIGREDLLYGYDSDDVPTPIPERNYMTSFLDIVENNGVEVLVTDYCSTQSRVNDSYIQNNAKGYISYAADHRELDNIPTYPNNPFNENSNNITTLSEANNFLYLINPSSFSTKTQFLDAIRNTNYDIVLIDAFFMDKTFTFEDISILKIKANGRSRLIICYMSIGEAEDYRYYWKSNWETNPPTWIEEENPDWEGNYKVRYWDSSWQNIIYGNDESYLKKIIDVGFDGVYLDIIDGYEYFEKQ